MSSSEAAKPNFSRRFFWWAIFLVILFGGYSAGWFFVASKVEERVDQSIVRLADKGIVARCDGRSVGGYPFRLGLFCDSVAYQDEARQVSVTAAALRTAAQVYQPFHTVAELNGPMRIEVPDLPMLWLDWDNLKASVRIAQPLPERVSIEVDNILASTDPDDETDPVQLFTAEHLEAHLRPNGADIDWAGNFRELAITAEAVQGRTIPPLAGEGDATIKNGVALTQARPLTLRGQSLEIRTLALSSGEGSVAISGPLSVDADGLLNADLKVVIRNPSAVAEALKTAIPERAREIQTGFAGLAIMGDQPTLPLKISKGRATLGFIPLGDIKPLE